MHVVWSCTGTEALGLEQTTSMGATTNSSDLTHRIEVKTIKLCLQRKGGVSELMAALGVQGISIVTMVGLISAK